MWPPPRRHRAERAPLCGWRVARRAHRGKCARPPGTAPGRYHARGPQAGSGERGSGAHSAAAAAAGAERPGHSLPWGAACWWRDTANAQHTVASTHPAVDPVRQVLSEAQRGFATCPGPRSGDLRWLGLQQLPPVPERPPQRPGRRRLRPSPPRRSLRPSPPLLPAAGSAPKWAGRPREPGFPAVPPGACTRAHTHVRTHACTRSQALRPGLRPQPRSPLHLGFTSGLRGQERGLGWAGTLVDSLLDSLVSDLYCVPPQ